MWKVVNQPKTHIRSKREDRGSALECGRSTAVKFNHAFAVPWLDPQAKPVCPSLRQKVPCRTKGSWSIHCGRKLCRCRLGVVDARLTTRWLQASIRAVKWLSMAPCNCVMRLFVGKIARIANHDVSSRCWRPIKSISSYLLCQLRQLACYQVASTAQQIGAFHRDRLIQQQRRPPLLFGCVAEELQLRLGRRLRAALRLRGQGQDLASCPPSCALCTASREAWGPALTWARMV